MWEDKQTDNKELEMTVVTLVLAVINIFKGEQEIKSMSGLTCGAYSAVAPIFESGLLVDFSPSFLIS